MPLADPARRLSAALRAASRPDASVSDAELLARFVACAGDREAAFAELVRRHGRLVRGTARRVLGGRAEADDVFQAAFLLLARKAAGGRWEASVAPWLYAATCRLAMKVRGRPARRTDPVPVADLVSPAPPPDAGPAWAEVRAILDEELARLPAAYRDPLVLCYLEGLTRDEAAAALGCPPGVLKGRLERGRKKLRLRLDRRGLDLAAGLAAVVAAGGPAVAAELAAAVAASAAGVTGSAVPAVALAVVTRVRLAAFLGVVAAVACGAGVFAVPHAPGAADTPTAAAAAPEPAAAVDALGDPLPPGAVARLGTVRLRPGTNTSLLAFDPDGRTLLGWSVVGDLPGRVYLWDTATGKEVRRVDVPGVAPKAVRWLPGGRGLAVVRTARQGHAVWEFTDPAAPLPVATDKLHATYLYAGEILPVAISPDGKRVAAGRYRRGPFRNPGPPTFVPLAVWDAAPGITLESTRPRWEVPRPDDCIGLTFSPDGGQLIGVFVDDMPRVEDQPPPPPAAAVVVRWDAATGRELGSFRIPNPTRKPHFATRQTHNRHLPLAVAPDGRTLWIGFEDGTARGWTLADGREGRTITLTKGTVDSLELTADGQTLAVVVCEPDWLWFRNGVPVALLPTWSEVGAWNLATGMKRFGERYGGWVNAGAVSPDGRVFAAATSEGDIHLRDAAGRPAVVLPGHDRPISAAAVRADGRTAVTAGADGRVITWDLATGRQTATAAVESPVAGKAVQPAFFAAAGWGLFGQVDGRPYRFNAAGKGTSLARPDGINYVAPVPVGTDGSVLLSTPGKAVWLNPDGRPRWTLDLPDRGYKPEMARLTAAALSPDGRTLVLVGLYLWEQEGVGGGKMHMYSGGWAAAYNPATGRRLRDWHTKTAGLYGAAFTPDGRALIVSGAPGRNYPDGQPARQDGLPDPREAIRVFDPVALRPLSSFDPRPGTAGWWSVTVSALSPDGCQFAAVGGGDGTVTVYETATGRVRRTLRGDAAYVRGLTFAPDGRRLVSFTDLSGLVWDVTPPRPDHPVVLSPVELDRAWADLTSADAPAAHRAMGALVADPAGVPAVGDRLRPPAAPTDAEVDALIAGLDAAGFADRQAAGAKLDALGERAARRVREKLSAAGSAEVRQRLEEFLERHARADRLTGPRLRERRSVELLEAAGTPAARAVLAKLAAGPAGDPLARDAAAAVARLGGRN